MQNIPSYLRAISPFPSLSLRRYTLNTSCKNLCFPHVTTIIPWEVLETNQPAGSWECSTSRSGQCCAAVDRGCSQRMSEVWLCGIASELAHGLIFHLHSTAQSQTMVRTDGHGQLGSVPHCSPTARHRPMAGPRFWQACRPGTIQSQCWD